MASDESIFLTCPSCSAHLDFDKVAERTTVAQSLAPLYLPPAIPLEEVQCPYCGWQFITDGFVVEEDGDVEGEAELEIDAEGDIVVPADSFHDLPFPPWHGCASARNEHEGRGMRDSGSILYDVEELIYGDNDVEALPSVRRCLCPSCAHLFRDVHPAQIFCADCGCLFSLGCEELLERQEELDWDDEFPGSNLDATGIDEPIVVCPHGTGHFRTVREALDAQHFNQTILLRPGLHESWDVARRPVRVLGDGPREEIVVRAEANALTMDHRQSLLRNVTVQGVARTQRRKHAAIDLRAGTVEDCDITSDIVACVLLSGGNLRRCVLHDSEGPGVLSRGGVIDGCEVLHNVGPGILLQQHGTVVVGCQVHDGHAEGVLIGPGASGELQDCVVRDNRSAGVLVRGPRSALRRCRVHGNGAGGVNVIGGAVEIRRCDIHRNRGNALRNTDGGLHVFASRIHHAHGVAVVTAGSAVTHLRHCALFRNRKGVLADNPDAPAALSACELWNNGGATTS